jgi:hypothetical protein
LYLRSSSWSLNLINDKSAAIFMYCKAFSSLSECC